jgi:hypothetical protein
MMNDEKGEKERMQRFPCMLSTKFASLACINIPLLHKNSANKNRQGFNGQELRNRKYWHWHIANTVQKRNLHRHMVIIKRPILSAAESRNSDEKHRFNPTTRPVDQTPSIRQSEF